MKIRGERYSFLGTAIAIVVIILFIILQKYVFKPQESQDEKNLPTEGTIALSTVEAEFSTAN